MIYWVPDDVLALVDLLLQDGGEMPGVQTPLRLAVPQVSQHLKTPIIKL